MNKYLNMTKEELIVLLLEEKKLTNYWKVKATFYGKRINELGLEANFKKKIIKGYRILKQKSERKSDKSWNRENNKPSIKGDKK